MGWRGIPVALRRGWALRPFASPSLLRNVRRRPSRLCLGSPAALSGGQRCFPKTRLDEQLLSGAVKEKRVASYRARQSLARRKGHTLLALLLAALPPGGDSRGLIKRVWVVVCVGACGGGLAPSDPCVLACGLSGGRSRGQGLLGPPRPHATRVRWHVLKGLRPRCERGRRPGWTRVLNGPEVAPPRNGLSLRHPPRAASAGGEGASAPPRSQREGMHASLHPRGGWGRRPG